MKRALISVAAAIMLVAGCGKGPAPHKVGISGLIGPLDIPFGVPPYPQPGIVRFAADNNGNLIESIGGAPYSSPSGPTPAIGAALTGATSQTVNPASDAASLYALTSTRTTNGTLTLGVSGSPITSSVVSIWIQAGGAFTYTIQDDASTTLATVPANASRQVYDFYFNGTHYVFLSFVYSE